MSLITDTLPEALRYGHGIFQSRGLDVGVIMSAVYDALIAAAANFEPTYGTRFFAYAKPYVRGEICKLQRRTGRDRETFIAWKDDIDEEEALEDSYVPPRRAELPPYGCSPDPEPAFWRDCYRRIKPVLDQTLSTRERAVLELYFKAGLTTQEVSDTLGTSRSSVHYIREHAFRRLRKNLIKSHWPVYSELQKLCI